MAEKRPKPEYSKDHKPGLRVPKGGSMCKNCEYLTQDQKNCKNEYFIKWNGSALIPAPIDQYCSDWYEPENKIRDTKFEDVDL